MTRSAGFPHCFARTVVFGERIVEGDFPIAEAGFFAACARGSNVLGKLDQFFENLRSRQCISVIAGDRGVPPAPKEPSASLPAFVRMRAGTSRVVSHRFDRFEQFRGYHPKGWLDRQNQ
jgi:hypothetical protein